MRGAFGRGASGEICCAICLALAILAAVKIGNVAPYGYRLDNDGKTLVEDEAEQAVITEAVRLREVEEFSYRKIAQALWNKKMRPRPVPNERRSRLTTKRLGEFDPTQVKRMIDAHKVRAKFSD